MLVADIAVRLRCKLGQQPITFQPSTLLDPFFTPTNFAAFFIVLEARLVPLFVFLYRTAFVPN